MDDRAAPPGPALPVPAAVEALAVRHAALPRRRRRPAAGRGVEFEARFAPAAAGAGSRGRGWGRSRVGGFGAEVGDGSGRLGGEVE